MRFYIASRQQETARAMRDAVIALGHSITSHWIEDPEFGAKKSDPEAHYKKWSVLDEQDVRDCDELILLTEPGQYSMGGRHTETGMAIALGKRVNVVGGRENVFHRHPLAHNFEDAAGFIRDLRDRDMAGYQCQYDFLRRSLCAKCGAPQPATPDEKRTFETSGFLHVPDAVIGHKTLDCKSGTPKFGPAEGDKIVIGIVGTVSAGKSTLARELAHRLGDGGYIGEVVPEFAREYKQRYGKIESPYEQLVILQEQLIREQTACISTKADIVLLETPSFVSEIYAQFLLNKAEEFDANSAAS